MLTSKKMNLKPLFDSEEGVHLTAYLVNSEDLIDLKAQLRDVIDQASEWLSPIMMPEEQNKFLEPLYSLLVDSRILKQMKGNIGIFRNQESFRVLNVPVRVEKTCQIATSFHVKPLLKWLQTDQEFLLLGIERDSAHLYFGSQDSFKLVDSILFPEALTRTAMRDGYISLKEARILRAQEDETFSWLNDWILRLTAHLKPKLFLAGKKTLVEGMKRSLKYPNSVETPISYSFNSDKSHELCLAIRKTLEKDSRDLFESSLQEFRFAEEEGRVQKNIFHICRAVVRRKVRKLIITDDLNIFGKIDKNSGGIAIHPFDLDHEDDDLLDDLAQMVLKQGGEVIVASRQEIPKGRPILAILEGSEVQKQKTTDFEDHQNHRERMP